MNGQAATLARVTGLVAALILAAILGILVGTVLDSLVERVTTPQSNIGGMVPENPGGTSIDREATPQSNLGGLVPENPGGTIVTERDDIDPRAAGSARHPTALPTTSIRTATPSRAPYRPKAGPMTTKAPRTETRGLRM